MGFCDYFGNDFRFSEFIPNNISYINASLLNKWTQYSSSRITWISRISLFPSICYQSNLHMLRTSIWACTLLLQLVNINSMNITLEFSALASQSYELSIFAVASYDQGYKTCTQGGSYNDKGAIFLAHLASAIKFLSLQKLNYFCNLSILLLLFTKRCRRTCYWASLQQSTFLWGW